VTSCARWLLSDRRWHLRLPARSPPTPRGASEWVPYSTAILRPPPPLLGLEIPDRLLALADEVIEQALQNAQSFAAVHESGIGTIEPFAALHHHSRKFRVDRTNAARRMRPIFECAGKPCGMVGREQRGAAVASRTTSIARRCQMASEEVSQRAGGSRADPFDFSTKGRWRRGGSMLTR
jgi:hypothetical protein